MKIAGQNTTKPDNRIWTENLDIGRNCDVDISGQIYMHDDLEINGSSSSVKLAGEYYGFSKSNSGPDGSSAIIINGAKATLDIEKLDTQENLL